MKFLKPFFLFTVLIFISMVTGCYSQKNTPFYDSQWIMQNYDNNMQLYYHHLILKPDHTVTLRTSYADSTKIIVWTGKYKLDSKKITFNFENCIRYEDGKNMGQYEDKRLVKFYNGEYLYSTGLLDKDVTPDSEKVWHLQLIRPKNQIYGETKDIYGNYFEDFVKVDPEQLSDEE